MTIKRGKPGYREYRAQNNLASKKSRQKKQEAINKVLCDYENLLTDNLQLQFEIERLKSELEVYKKLASITDPFFD